MGTYVNNGVVSLGTSYDYDDAVREIGQLLGVGPREDGMYNIADVCQASSINLWARYKPFGYNSDNFDYDPKSPSGAKTRRANAAKLANYGITVPNVSFGSNSADVSKMAKEMFENPCPWIYNYPKGRTTGNDNEPFRLRDFDGYDHNAKCPIAPEQSSLYTIVRGSGTVSVSFNYILNIDTTSSSVTLGEIKGLDNWSDDFSSLYVGACLFDPSSYSESNKLFSRIYYTTLSKTYQEYLDDSQHNEIGFTFNVAGPSFTGDTYNYIGFLFFSSGETLYPLPNSIINYTVERGMNEDDPADAKKTIYAEAFTLNGTRPLYYRITVSNPDNSAWTFKYYINGYTNNGEQILLSSETTITIPAKSTVYIPSASGGTRYDDAERMSYVELYRVGSSSADNIVNNKGYVYDCIDVNDAPFNPFA